MHASAPSALRTEWRPLDGLDSVADEWRTLAERAVEPNVFLEPAFALAAAPALGRDVGATLVWSGPRLVGLFPARIERRRYGLPLPILVGWSHAFGPLGTPLVDRNAVEPTITAWLDALRDSPAMPGALMLPFMTEDGAVAKTLRAVLAARGSPAVAFGPHRRALLAPGERAGYLDRTIGPKKRKELRRQRRRLQDTGAGSLTTAEDPAAVAGALTGFMTLEASGWKGRGGTAATQDEHIRRFMTQAVVALAGERKAAVHRLGGKEQPAAVAITLRSGDTAWFWKIAYDESLARLSPGVLLSLGVTETLLSDDSVARADSCAVADHPMIDHLWGERLALADLLVALRPNAKTSFALTCRLEALRRGAIGAARSLKRRLRG